MAHLGAADKDADAFARMLLLDVRENPLPVRPPKDRRHLQEDGAAIRTCMNDSCSRQNISVYMFVDHGLSGLQASPLHVLP